MMHLVLPVSLLLLRRACSSSSSSEETSDLIENPNPDAAGVEYVSRLKSQATLAKTQILPMVELDSLITVDWKGRRYRGFDISPAIKTVASANTLNHWPILESELISGEDCMILRNQLMSKSIVIVPFHDGYQERLLNQHNFGTMARLRLALGHSVNLYIGRKDGDKLEEQIAEHGTRFMVDRPDVTLRICPIIKNGNYGDQCMMNLNSVIEYVLTQSDNGRLNIAMIPKGNQYDFLRNCF